ncbi:MAG TPA: glycosyltransferase family 39 protein, partial [Verrucomicrobiae bacterium]|nr:glycosyltransferase family 39 protein [Verrucomicrobiae bacterium]
MARLKIGYLLLLFLFGLLPFAAHFLLHYPDERHYMDGAIYMVRDGSWVAPKTAEGTLRFQKPILPYWTVAAGYELGGINVLMSRLPFLLIGGLTLWLTYRLALRLYRDTSVAILAALILLSHPQFILGSTRSMPDGLLCFSVLLGAYGFLRLIVLEEKSAGAFWAAYGGVALAVLSKGLLGIGLLAFAWGFAWSRTRKLATLRQLLHWPSMLTGAFVAFGWFATVIILHGHEVWATFWDDQVSGNLGGTWWSP